MTPKDWEALGRKAVVAGFPWRDGAVYWVGEGRFRLSAGWVNMAKDAWPDFSDELTALACIPWVRGAALKALGDSPLDGISINLGSDGASVTVHSFSEHPVAAIFRGLTLPHACMEAIEVAKEAV